MTPEQRAAWEVDAARVRELAALIDASDVTTADSCDAVCALANEAQVDLLQVKWRPADVVAPRDEWVTLYRLVNEACARWTRRRCLYVIQLERDQVADGIRAALARVPGARPARRGGGQSMTCERCNGRGWYEDACGNARWCACAVGQRLRATPLPPAAQAKIDELNRKIDENLASAATPRIFVSAVREPEQTDAAKIERDRLLYGTGYGRRRLDGTIEHIPALEVIAFHRVDTPDPERA